MTKVGISAQSNTFDVLPAASFFNACLAKILVSGPDFKLNPVHAPHYSAIIRI